MQELGDVDDISFFNRLKPRIIEFKKDKFTRDFDINFKTNKKLIEEILMADSVDSFRFLDLSRFELMQFFISIQGTKSSNSDKSSKQESQATS